MADLPLCGHRIGYILEVRRFFCGHAACKRAIFCERLDRLAEAYGRRTQRLNQLLTHIGLLVSGEVAAKLIQAVGVVSSPDTLPRLVRKFAYTTGSTPEENDLDGVHQVGVDDWAILKGHTYGTLVVDLEKRRPIALFR